MKLVVRNKVQKALYDIELSGQFSDGFWENSRPFDRWVPWCNAEIVVSETGEDLGRDFYTPGVVYNINNSELLKYVGDRMLNICNMIENGVDEELVYEYYDIEDYLNLDNMTRDDKYWVDKYNGLIESFGSAEAYRETLKGSYNMAKMRKELADLKKIMKIEKY